MGLSHTTLRGLSAEALPLRLLVSFKNRSNIHTKQLAGLELVGRPPSSSGCQHAGEHSRSMGKANAPAL